MAESEQAPAKNPAAQRKQVLVLMVGWAVVLVLSFARRHFAHAWPIEANVAFSALFMFGWVMALGVFGGFRFKSEPGTSRG